MNESLPKDGRLLFENVAVEDLDPSNQDIYFNNLHDSYFERLRKEDPVHFCKKSEFGPYWSITKYADIVEIEKNPHLFSARGGFTIVDIPSDTKFRSFLTMDPPEHKTRRQAITPMVSLSNLNRIEDHISRLVTETLDNLPINEPFDWVEKVSIEISIKVLALMMGVPVQDSSKLIRWSDIASTVPRVGTDIETLDQLYFQLQDCYSYFSDLLGKHSSSPGENNFISMLAHQAKNEKLHPEELFVTILALILAGNDTTRHSITASGLLLHQFPEQRKFLYSDPSLLKSAVPEIIRFQTPVAHFRRTATEDILFRGKEIKKNDKIILWFISANRDEDEIENPKEFIINRKNPDHHLSFGSGIHKCIGRNIALMELEILWNEIIRRKWHVEPISEPTRVKSNIVHGFSSLNVTIKQL
jgi:cytochrome P450